MIKFTISQKGDFRPKSSGHLYTNVQFVITSGINSATWAYLPVFSFWGNFSHLVSNPPCGSLQIESRGELIYMKPPMTRIPPYESSTRAEVCSRVGRSGPRLHVPEPYSRISIELRKTPSCCPPTTMTLLSLL